MKVPRATHRAARVRPPGSDLGPSNRHLPNRLHELPGAPAELAAADWRYDKVCPASQLDARSSSTLIL